MKIFQVGIAAVPFLLILPLSVFSQQTGEQPTQEPTQQTQQKSEGSATTEPQPVAPADRPQKSGQPQAQQQSRTEAKISVMSFADSKVVDAEGKEIGAVKDILIDSHAGRIDAVNIEMSGERGGLLGGRQRGQLISVPWDSVTPKEQDGRVVLALDHKVIPQVEGEKPRREPQERQQTQGQQQKPAQQRAPQQPSTGQ